MADKWSDLKTQSYLDKKKRHRNLEEAKLDLGGVKKKAIFEKSLSKKKKYEATTETFLKDERWQLCQSVDQADVKNTLLKFGLVSHLFEDAQKFRKSMKSLQDLIPKNNKKKKKGKSGMKAEKEVNIDLSFIMVSKIYGLLNNNNAENMAMMEMARGNDHFDQHDECYDNKIVYDCKGNGYEMVIVITITMVMMVRR